MIIVPASDHGAIYVVELNRPLPHGLTDKTDTALMAVFGKVVLNTDYVDVVTTGLLTDMTLPDLIRNGYDMPVDEATAATLRGLIGTVVLVMSAAFGGAAMSIDLPADVRLVTVLRDGPTPAQMDKIHTKAAKGVLTPNTKPAKSDARIGGMVATVALLVLFLLVAIMIWIAG